MMYSYPDGNSRRENANYREAARFVASRTGTRHGGCVRSALAWWLRPIPATCEADRWDRQTYLTDIGLRGHEGGLRINYQLCNATSNYLRMWADGHDCGCAHLWEGRDELGRPLILD